MKLTQFLPLTVAVLATSASAQIAAPGVTETPAPEFKVILTPAQTSHILKELEKVETQIGKGRGGVFGAAMAKFREGMASPAAAVALFQDCVKLVKFERKNLKQADFADWRTKHEIALKDEDYKRALMVQLEYLVLSIQAQDIEEPKKLAPIVTSLQAYLGKAAVAIQGTASHTASGALVDNDKKDGKGNRKAPEADFFVGDSVATLRQSVKESVFAKAYSLDDFFKREEWEYQPLSVKGIYTNAIFPYYLAEKPTDLSAQWDARISAEMTMRKALMSESEFNEFSKDAGPRLLWEKDNYLVKNDVNAVNAMADMLKVIQTYPSHPDANNWLKEFRMLVKKVSEPGSVPEVPGDKPAGAQ